MMKIINGMEKKYEDYKKVNSTDAYSNRVVTYGEEWADLMEKEIAKGLDIFSGPKNNTIADVLAHKADTDGITGFMYGAAVFALSEFWVHGEALRRWHNLATQIRNEGEIANAKGGTLNPALLNIEI